MRERIRGGREAISGRSLDGACTDPEPSADCVHRLPEQATLFLLAFLVQKSNFRALK